MATERAKRPCQMASCKAYAVNRGYCDQHQQRISKCDAARGSSHARGYDRAWAAARADYLDEHPLCVHCAKKRNMIVPATVVDHIQPHKGDKNLFWDVSNWQALCESCHNRKTATEDRGSWSTVKPKPRLDHENEFEIGDKVICQNLIILDRMGCDDSTVWEVLDVADQVIEVTDGNQIRQLHHSHFRKVG